MNNSLCHDQIDINCFAHLKIEEQPLIRAILNPPKYNQIYSIFKLLVIFKFGRGKQKVTKKVTKIFNIVIHHLKRDIYHITN